MVVTPIRWWVSRVDMELYGVTGNAESLDKIPGSVETQKKGVEKFLREQERLAALRQPSPIDYYPDGTVIDDPYKPAAEMQLVPQNQDEAPIESMEDTEND